MSNIDKQAVQAVADLKAGYTLGHADVAILNELARIALASLEAEAVADVVAWSSPNEERTCDVRLRRHDINAGPLYTAPPASVSVPDRSMFEKWWESEHGLPLDSWDSLRATDGYCDDGIDGQFEAWSACRVAMLQGADSELQRKAAILDTLCKKYNVESLADFVDWQRNHIAELEAAPPAPAGEGETAVMPDYPGYVMTQRECFDAGAKRAVPDGWVACSERMPEESGRYWCYVEEQNDLGKSHYQWNCAWNGKSWWIDHEDGGRVTHWQPLTLPPV